MTPDIRYVTDVPYAAGFTAELAPEVLDLVALISGFTPPERGDGFACCELGCGPGLASIIFAATHPEGRFHAVDAMPDHVARGQAIADQAGLRNLTFHAMDFGAACDLDLPKFQYIGAHGVYAWIDDAAQADFRQFIARHLAPGGLVYVSYNAMPGWAADAPLQHLFLTLAAGERGNSLKKFDAAAAQVTGFLKAGASALRASPIATDLAEHATRERPTNYYAHEYLAPAWRPLYVDEMRRQMASIGLSPIGSATVRDNFDSFVLRAAAREALQAIEDPDRRELVRDYFMAQRFRRDVFGRAVAPLAEDRRRERLLAMPFALMRPAERVEYTLLTEAGSLGFDNEAARRIVAALEGGPRSLADCDDGTIPAQDLLANGLALACAYVIRPVAARAVDVTRLNAALRDGLDPKIEPNLHVTPHGGVFRFAEDLLKRLFEGSEIPEKMQPWAEFLRRQG